VSVVRTDAVRSLLMTELFLPHRGGSRVYYYHLYKGWAPDPVTVLTRKVPGWQKFDARESNEDFRIVRRLNPRNWAKLELSNSAFLLANAAKIVKRQAVDVVHSGDLFPHGVSALLLKRFFSVPYIAFSHGEDFTLTDRSRRESQMRDRIYRGADTVIANAEYSRKRLLDIGVPEERVHKLTPAVDTHEFSPAPPDAALQARYDLVGKFVLLTVARLIPRKGHDMVIRALANLAPKFPSVRYLIVGKGPEESRLRKLADELQVSKLTHFAGFIPDEQLPDYYRMSDLMVMPNREENGDIEGFGITFLEASATGKPVIGGRSGGAGESVKEGVSGELVDGRNLGELTARIREFIDQPAKRETMGTAGRLRAQSEFDWKPRAERLHAITRSLALRYSSHSANTRVGMRGLQELS